MSVMDWYNQRKKEEEDKKTSSSSGGVAQSYADYKYYSTFDISGVNDDYINTFISDANKFFKGTEDTYKGIGWGNASSVYDSTNSTWQDLKKRQDTIKAWLYKNKSKLTEDSYKNLYEALNNIDSSASSVLKGFEGAKNFYGQWATEDDFNQWQAKEDEKQAILNAEDFEANSGYVSTKYESGWDRVTSKYGLGYEDLAYEYINDVDGMRSKIKNKASIYGLDTKDSESTYEDKAYDELEADEIKIYNYLYSTQGKDKAQEYLDSLGDTLQRRKAETYVANIGDSAFLKVAFNAYVGLDQWASGVENLVNFVTGDEGNPTSAVQYAGSMIRENIESEFWRTMWDLGVTVSNQLPSILVGTVTGGVGGLATMGASVLGNSYAEMRNLGYNEWQSRGYATLVTAAELGLQYLIGGYKKLGGKLSNGATEYFASMVDNGIAKFAIRTGGSMISEGIEEALQSVLEPTFQAFVTGEWDNYKVDWSEVIYSGLLGALSAGVLEGAPSGIATLVKNRTAKNVYGNSAQDLVNETLEITPEGNRALVWAEKYQNKLDKGKNLSGQQLRNLVEANERTLTDSDTAKMKDAVKARLTQLGETGDVSALADIIVKDALSRNQAVNKKTATGENLTLLEKNTLKNSDYGQRVANEMSPKNIKGGGYASNWTKEIGTERLNSEEYNPVEEGYKKAVDMFGKGVNVVTDDNDVEGEKPTTYTLERKTTYAGQEVSIREISSIKDGEVYVRLDNGEEANVRDIEFSRDDEALIYEAVADMNPETARDLIEGFNQGNTDGGKSISFEHYLRGFNEAYRYGSVGIPVAEMSRNGFSAELSDEQRQIAYNRGKADAIGKVKANQAKVDSAKNAQSSTPVKKSGRVTYLDGAKPSGARQKSAVKAIEILSESIGNNWYVFRSYVENGVRVYKDKDGKIKPAPNGKYDTATGDIYIDLNAGNNGEGLMIFTMAHELTHFIREWSPAKFKVFADFLLEQYGVKGESVEGLIQKKIARAKERNKELSYDHAYEEVIADSCESMLRDSNAIEAIAKLKAKDATIWEKIKSFISKLVAKIRAAYAKLNPDSKEGQMVLEMKEVAEKLQALWTEALMDAGEAYSATKATVKETTSNEEVQLSDRDNFIAAIDQWNRDGKPDGETFILGSTGNVLQGLGAIENDIYMQGDKIKQILSQHPEMTLAEIKKIPQILENPALILKSRNVGRGNKQNTRLVIFGTIKAKNGSPILTVLDLRPSENHFIIDDLQKVTSAYTKTSDPTSFVRNSDVLYAEKKRATSVLRSIGFHMPIELNESGFIGSISYNGRSVNIFGESFSKIFSEGDVLYSDRVGSEDSEAEWSRLRQEYNTAWNSAQEAKKKLDSIGKNPRQNEIIDIISNKNASNEAIHEALEAQRKWEQESGYSKAYEEYNSLDGKARELRREADRMEERLSKALREKKYSDEEIRETVQKAVRKYRTTSRIDRASYLLTTGSMLDFSEGQGYRVKDHREISEILNLPDYAQHSDGMIIFMNMGNIRLQTYGIDISSMPNNKQITALRGIISEVMREYDEFTVDFSKPNGNSDGSVTYPKGVSSARIISDIKNYFETGNIPEYNDSLSQFRYSDRDSKPLEERVYGDDLLNAQDLIDTVKGVGGIVDKNGYIKLYHRTSTENAEKIRNTGVMRGKEDGLFFSTSRDGQVDGCGNAVVEFSIPAEKLLLDDIFDNEAHLRLPMKGRGMNVTSYLVESASNKSKYSDRDSAGNQLSKEQQEFFKDSKVRDEQGNLQVVYHGTRKADFTEFKRNINFFTDSSEMADSYAPSGEQFVGYLNIKKPFVIDAKGERWSRVPIDEKVKSLLEKYGASTFKEKGKWRTSPADIASAIESGIDEGELDYDGIIIKNIDDTGRYWKTRDNIVANDYITFKSNQFKNADNKTPTSNPDIRYSDRVTDKETLDFLENQEHVTVYRAMQLIDGKLYPPMNAYTKDEKGNKVLVTPSEIGAWEQSVERPDLIDPKTGKFKLDKGKVDGGKQGTVVPAAYNPYIHTSLSMLNDQFTSAYQRSNLVVVKGVVPKSELTSGYKAQFAKDSVGETEWHSGVVSTQLPESRKVILSRWFKPVEIMDNDVVAQNIKEMLGDTGIEIPYNVVSPKLRRSLEKIGVPIGEGRGIRNLPKKDDVKYSERYSYETLTSKPDMEVKMLSEASNSEISIYKNNSNLFSKKMREIASKANNTKNTSTSTYLYCRDLDEDVLVTRESFKHSAARMDAAYISVCKSIADVLNNSIVVNELKERSDTNGGYVLLGLAETKDSYVVVRSIVNKKTWKLEDYNELYAIKKKSIKKEDVGLKPPHYIQKNGYVTSSVISIADFLEFVNTQTIGNSVLSADVVEKLASKRGFDENVTPNLLYSDRDTDGMSNRSLLANALETAVQNDIERNKLEQYKAKIDLINSEEAKLHELNRQLREAMFSTGVRDSAKIRSLKFEANQTASRINTYDRQLLTLEASKPLKAVLEREKRLAYDKAEKAGVKALLAYKEKAAQTTRELMNRYQESRAKGVESRHKTEIRNKIKKVVGDLNQLLLRPTKDKHIKEGLKIAVAEALSLINMDTVGAEARIAKINDAIAKAKDPDVIAELSATRDRIQLQGENLRDKLTALQTAYENIKNSTDAELKNAYQEPVMNAIKNVVAMVGNTSIRDMSLTQLEAVYEMYSMILHTVRTANKAFKAKKGETITQLAESVNAEVRKVGKEKFRRNPLIAGLRKVGWTLLKPLYAFRTIGSDTFTGLYDNLRSGEDVYYVDVNEAKNFIQAQYKKHNFKSWDQKQTKTFTAKSGKTFTLNLEQMMSLYAYSRRNQAHDHIIEGGIVLEDSVIETKNKLGLPVKYKVDTKSAFNISEETLQEICDSLTAEQKAFVEEMQTYLSEVMGAKGNEVSMELLGVELFKEKFYFPLKSSKYYMGFKPEEAGEIKLKNPAFSKETVQHANNPVVLKSFTDVWATHINDMSMYHAFVLPLEDFTRVYNYKTKTDANLETVSTEATIANIFGEGATQYIRNFLRSLNGGVRTESVSIADKAVSLSKKGAVLGSASVMIQQPSAIMRAMAHINPMHFVASTHKSINLVKHKQDWAELKKYAPIAGIKEMGRFDVGMGQSTVKWIKDQNTILENADEILSKAPAFMDEVTWIGIWNAVKNEVKHQHKDLAVGSEEYLKKCGERFTEVISLTQVYDSVFSRSDIMRNPSWIAKALTAFMAEPSTTLNMLVDSFIQGKRTGKVGGFVKTTASTSGAILGAIVLNAALKSIITAMRDDDEDESYAEKYLGAFVGNATDDLNPLSYIPFVKDIVSIFKGYDVERMDMALFSDFKQAIDAFDSDSKTDYEKWSGLIGAISAFFGVPFKNVERDIRGAINTIISFSEGEKTTGAGIKESIREALTGDKDSNSQQLYEAIISGDQAQIDRVKSRFKDQSDIDSAIKKALRENDSRIREAAQARIDGDISLYTRIAQEIISEGHFKQDYVVGAINAEINAIKREQAEAEGTTEDSTGVEEDEVTSIYKGDDVNVAFDNGDTALAKEIIQDLIDTKVANGMDETKAKSSVRSSMTSYWKPLYKQAYQNGDTAEMYRIRTILLNSGLYGKTNDVVTTVQNWLKD